MSNIRTTGSQDNDLTRVLMNGLNVDWSDIVNSISEIFTPEELFSVEDLELWAENNGYEKA